MNANYVVNGAPDQASNVSAKNAAEPTLVVQMRNMKAVALLSTVKTRSTFYLRFTCASIGSRRVTWYCGYAKQTNNGYVNPLGKS